MALHLSHVRSALIGASGLALLALFLLYNYNGGNASSNLHLSERPVGVPGSNILNHASNRTLGFQKIFVINLPSRTDYRDSMALAAALSDLQIEFVDGVTDVDEKTLPPDAKKVNLNSGSLYAWRAHLSAARMIVEQNLTSALILEGDVDWDIRIKQQMQDFARASQLLVQPLHGTTDRFLDPTHPTPQAGQSPQDFEVGDTAATAQPTTSPYGDIDRWDMLWLGHCGTRFPRLSDSNAPLGRAIIRDDETVPEKQHIHMQFGNDELVQQYPAHTRAVSRARMNTCTLGYALSQPGARRLLYELGIRKMTGTMDMMFRSLCDGVDGRPISTCFTVQPQLFQHHRPVGEKASFSDISDHGTEFNDRAFTRNIRWSTKLNFPKLVYGETDYIDLFKDGESSPDLGF
ncbi:glycosyltransferase family 25 protein [Diplodia corticola]|uniref:Glycosyltransferase family 25 protein n=1 Tax=Diplodia corticola TaxID=236234 RepID=A0A1J9RP42_9PEZI|nr:glycosyltransferase family 25 protein [Diplodia corticola]OJD29341.1 glycosyltransferase family 25 protein [Diplodia corticola]